MLDPMSILRLLLILQWGSPEGVKSHVSPRIWAAATPWNRYQNLCEEDENGLNVAYGTRQDNL